MTIYLTGILIEEPLYINQEIKLSFIGNNLKGFDLEGNGTIQSIKAIRTDVSLEALKELIPKASRVQITEINKKPTYNLAKIEMLFDDMSEFQIEEIIIKNKEKQLLKQNNIISKMVSNTKDYLSDMLWNDNQYILKIKEQKGCLNSGIFNDFDDINPEQLKTINKLPCIFDSRILLPALNTEEYADGCVHSCAKHVLDEHPGIKKKVIERFLNCIDKGVYDKLLIDKTDFSRLPQLLSDKELEYINNFQKQNIESVERRFNLKGQSSKKTLKNKRESAIIFNGNNLNPLPLELFNFWRIVIERYIEFIQRFEINKSIISQWDIVPLELQDLKDKSHYEELSLEDKRFLFPFNSSIVISLYRDEELKQDLFYIALQFPPLDTETFKNRNQITLIADEYLKNVYYYWKTFRDKNIRKYNKAYKRGKTKENYKTSKEFICQNCLLADTCNRLNCYLSEDEFDTLINKNHKLNLHIHKLGSPTLSLNEWKHVIDNITSTIDIFQFNICGDEPLLFPDLIELTKYIKSLGIKCSLETSGLFFTEKWLTQNIYLYDEITISVDSFDEDACAILGKINKNEKYLKTEDIFNIIVLIQKIRQDCKISIETKVMQINKHEKMLDNIKSLNILPEQWRIVKYEVTDNDFMYFINKNFITSENIYDSIPGLKIVIEDETNNYSFIDNNGVLCKKQNRRRKEIIDIATETFVEDILKQKIKIFDE